MLHIDKAELEERGLTTEREQQVARSENMKEKWQRQFVVRSHIFDAFLISEEIDQRKRTGSQPVEFGGRL